MHRETRSVGLAPSQYHVSDGCLPKGSLPSPSIAWILGTLNEWGTHTPHTNHPQLPTWHYHQRTSLNSHTQLFACRTTHHLIPWVCSYIPPISPLGLIILSRKWLMVSWVRCVCLTAWQYPRTSFSLSRGSQQATDHPSVLHLLSVWFCKTNLGTVPRAPWLCVLPCNPIYLISHISSSLTLTLDCLSWVVFNSNGSFQFSPYFWSEERGQIAGRAVKRAQSRTASPSRFLAEETGNNVI